MGAVQGTVVWDDIKDEHFDSLVDTLVYVPLETHPDGLFSSVDKLMIKQDRIFIFDFRSRNQVVAYDTLGRFLYAVGQRGKGPGEYTQIRNFTVDGSNIYLIDNNARRLLTYDIKDGQFLDEKRLSFWATDVVRFANGDFMFSWNVPMPMNEAHSNVNGQTRLVVTDEDLKIRRRLFSPTVNDCPIEHRSYFQQSVSGVAFNTYMIDTVTIFDPESPDSYVSLCFDFGSKAVPETYRAQWTQAQSYNYVESVPVVTSRHIVGNVHTGDEQYTYVFCKDNGTVYKGYNDANPFLVFLGSDDDGWLYTDFQVPSVYQFMVESGWPKASREVEERIFNGDYALVKLRLR